MRGGWGAVVVGRSLPLTRLLATAGVLATVSSVVGCGPNPVYQDTVERAESGVAIALRNTATQTANLLVEYPSLDDIPQERLVRVFLNDLRGDPETWAPIRDRRGVYDIVEEPDGTISFSVLLASSASGAGGLVTTIQRRHSCGVLTGRFSDREMSVVDAECPPHVDAIGGQSSIALSMTQNAAKHGIDITETS